MSILTLRYYPQQKGRLTTFHSPWRVRSLWCRQHTLCKHKNLFWIWQHGYVLPCMQPHYSPISPTGWVKWWHISPSLPEPMQSTDGHLESFTIRTLGRKPWTSHPNRGREWNRAYNAQRFTGQAISIENWYAHCQGLDHTTMPCPLRPRKHTWTSAFPRTQYVKAACIKYNKIIGDCKFGRECRFLHMCSCCGGSHPANKSERVETSYANS